MVFPFGVSVSDFISGVKIFKNAIESLSDTHGARADFAELCRSLDSLDRALRSVSAIKLDTEAHRQALKKTLHNCKTFIASFLVEVAKFQVIKDQYATKARLITNFRKIQWAICKKVDVKKFRLGLETHIGALDMLLLTFQTYVPIFSERLQLIMPSELVMRLNIQVNKTQRNIDDVATGVKKCVNDLTELKKNTSIVHNAQTERLSKIKSKMATCTSSIVAQESVLLDVQKRLKR